MKERIKHKLNAMYAKGKNQDWWDFFIASCIFFGLGNYSLLYFPFYGLWLGLHITAIFLMAMFLIFT